MLTDSAQSPTTSRLPLADLIFGSTLGMQEVRKTLEAALHDDLPVLIEGESGTGKEVVARYLHLCSKRADWPFVRVNCGAMPARLLDREMFGSGDLQERADTGSVDLAANGTLFLDEIGEMDGALQQKVLQALRAGSSRKEDGVNARIVCASSVDLKKVSREEGPAQVLSAQFGYRVRLLPLRERKQDIPQLCEYLVERFAREFGRSAPKLKPQVLESFQRWNWPGNIRELENWIARIVIFGSEEAMGDEFKRRTVERHDASMTRRHGLRLNANRMRRARRNGY